ncbi:MAG: hypothetical protein HRU20_17635 [Pseudomonadales bacterium]|nr:hypothetical protein [Pseudomonadales bacterium]
MPPELGSYGTTPPPLFINFEDECVGSQPLYTQGIVVSRIEADKIFVSHWQVHTHFDGTQLLEQFEEAKHTQNFEVSFSNEHELLADENLNGNDPLLKAHLTQKLRYLQQGLDKVQQHVPY